MSLISKSNHEFIERTNIFMLPKAHGMQHEMALSVWENINRRLHVLHLLMESFHERQKMSSKISETIDNLTD